MKIFEFWSEHSYLGSFYFSWGIVAQNMPGGYVISSFILPPSSIFGRNLWCKSPKKNKKATKRAVLIPKSKIVKAKLRVSKSCQLESTYFMICYFLGYAHLQNISFLRGPLTEFIFFNFSDIATYLRRLENQNQKLPIFQKLLSKNSHSGSSVAVLAVVLQAASSKGHSAISLVGRTMYAA